MFFKRVIISLFVFFAAFMLFVMIIRLGNNKDGFFGFSDLINYLDSGKVNFYKPLKSFNEDIGGIIRDFGNYIKNIEVNNPLDAIIVVVKGLAQLFKLLSIPVVAIFDFIKMLIGYLEIFTDFINYIISFDGYVASA